jgi:mycothione reductase
MSVTTSPLAIASARTHLPLSARSGVPLIVAIRDRVYGRIDPLHERAVTHRRANGVDVFLGQARFTGPKVLRVGGDELRADRFVLAAGSRPALPPLPGLAGVPYLLRTQ